MLRKFALAAAAGAALGAAAFAPTAASAHWHGGHGHWFGHGFGIYAAPVYVSAPDCYITKRLVETPYGLRWRRVEVCD
ncbi:MAG TPA: hypothetical protein VMI47_03480 [Pseudolabrys sp.]|nr:hypothetical protein [Pseudolabrys sp.]